MKHATKKYNEGHMDTIPEREPVFLLRGQDPTAWQLVEIWLILNYGKITHDRYMDVKRHADRMFQWPNKESK